MKNRCNRQRNPGHINSGLPDDAAVYVAEQAAERRGAGEGGGADTGRGCSSEVAGRGGRQRSRLSEREPCRGQGVRRAAVGVGNGKS